MNWEKLIISPKSSKLIKEKLSIINKNEKTDEKYIGVIPIYWNTLGIYYKNREKEKKEEIREEIKEEIRDGIKNIYTKKSQLIVSREFYYLENDLLESYYPVFKFSNDLSFTLREIKNQIRNWLIKEGFQINDSDKFDIFRIYKMNGFHIFSVILSIKTNLTNLKSSWKSNHSLELLPLTNNEITNPFMKISQLKHHYNINYGTISNIWLKTLEGYLLNENENIDLNNKINIMPYKIKWEEMLATLANLIDLESNENLHLYFIPRIENVKTLKINFK
jgi:hypothetical protein